MSAFFQNMQFDPNELRRNNKPHKFFCPLPLRSNLINFFNVPKISFFHVLGYFGHFSFFGLGGKNFGHVAKRGGKNFGASLRGVENFGPSIFLDNLGVNKYAIEKCGVNKAIRES